MTTTTVAFIETETGWLPSHIRDIKQGQTYYLVRDGVHGEIYTAIADAKQDVAHEGNVCWCVHSKPVE